MLSPEAFAKFMARLDSDSERAGEKYESLRLMLIKYFDWRGADFPEEFADETLNRIIRKIDKGETIDDIPTYCHGVGRLVFLEKLKSPDSKRSYIDDLSPGSLVAPEPEPVDERQECFEQCLNELPPENRQLILQYYKEEGRRKINNRLAQAESLGIPLNALRSRAQRIRDRLEDCVHRCKKRK